MSLLPLVGAAIGALASLMGVWMTAYLGRRRENRAAIGEAIVSLLNAWSNAYERNLKSHNADRFQGESAVATARLLVLVDSRDQERIGRIAKVTTNTLNERNSGLYIGQAQDILLEWHGRKLKNSEVALFEFERRMKEDLENSA